MNSGAGSPSTVRAPSMTFHNRFVTERRFLFRRLDFSEDLPVDHALEQRAIAQLAEI